MARTFPDPAEDLGDGLLGGVELARHLGQALGRPGVQVYLLGLLEEGVCGKQRGGMGGFRRVLRE